VLSPGDKVLMFETGHFATLWKNMATKLGLVPEYIASADPAAIEARLREDKTHAIKAVCVVHNEKASEEERRNPSRFDRLSPRRMGRRRHRGRLAEGLMLPPGLSFTAVRRKP
jgi:alanine-glyoxylate transaminase/serine-glyoxylate transaminase/serine-pyruvate transaminase